MFPEGSLADNFWDTLWRESYEDLLRWADSTSLWREAPAGEHYQYLTSRLPAGVLRVDGETGWLVAKQAGTVPLDDGTTGIGLVRDCRRQLAVRELRRFRELVESAGFWELPSPVTVSGLDGYRVLFEGLTNNGYHLVHRWCPERDGFARLCRFCESQYWNTIRPRRSWWRFGW